MTATRCVKLIISSAMAVVVCCCFFFQTRLVLMQLHYCLNTNLETLQK